ncbi:MAG: hypothetical protein R2746_17180 [Acidimicrobiales bacterium]
MAPRRPPAKPSSPATGRRAAAALGEVDGPRGQRDGRNRVARSQAQARRRFMLGMAVTVMLVGLLFVGVFPALPTSTSGPPPRRPRPSARGAGRAGRGGTVERLETPAEIERP